MDKVRFVYAVYADEIMIHDNIIEIVGVFTNMYVGDECIISGSHNDAPTNMLAGFSILYEVRENTSLVAINGDISVMNEEMQCKIFSVDSGDNVVDELAAELFRIMPVLETDVYFEFKHIPEYGYDFDTRDSQLGYGRIRNKTGVSRDKIDYIISVIKEKFRTPDLPDPFSPLTLSAPVGV